jgi:lysyl-tRNA synthetase class 2
MDEASDIIKERYKKLEGLKALGVDPFGGLFSKQAMAQALLDAYEENKKVSTAGRLSAMRFMGKSVFADLKDESGRIQLYLKKDHLPEADSKIFDLLDIGDIVGVEGELFKTKTGEISIRVERLRLLSGRCRKNGMASRTSSSATASVIWT